jgi:uncharacterized repeat protein (TIGR01451 family)
MLQQNPIAKHLLLSFFLMLMAPLAFAQLTITKSVDKTDVLSGETFTYTLQYRCASITDPCSNVTVTDVLPTGVNFHSLVGSVHTIGQAGAYDAGTRTVTFDFIDPLPAGSTGELSIVCYFPNGSTPEGTMATNTATIADGSTSVVSNPATVTAHATNQFCPALSTTQFGALGSTTAYSITVPVGDGTYGAPLGLLNPQDITIVQQLPLGATFVSAGNMERSASGGLPLVPENSITGTYDAGANTITWIIPNGLTGLSTGTYSGIDLPIRLTSNIIYASPPFSSGDIVSTSATATYTPLGTSTPLTLTGSSTGTTCEKKLVSSNHTLSPANPSANMDKSIATSTTLYSGQDVSYSMHWDNNGNVPLENFTVIDSIPDGLLLRVFEVASHSNAAGVTYTISYQTDVNPNYVTDNTIYNADTYYTIYPYASSGGSNLGVPTGERVTVIKIEFGTVPPNFYLAPSYWHYDVLETTVEVTETNCLTYTTTTTPYVPETDCDSFQHLPRPTYATPSPAKQYVVNGYSFSSDYAVLPIGDTTWVRMEVQSNASQPIINPVIMDLLPLGMVYDGAWTMPSNFNGLSLPMPTFEHIVNYNNTGRELLRWSWTASPTAFDLVTSVFARVRVTNLATPGVDIVNTYALSGSNVQGCYKKDIYDSTSGLLPDIYDLDNDGSTTDSLCFGTSNGSNSWVRVNAAAALESEKLVKGQLDTDWTKYPATGTTVPGGLADYRLKVENVGNVPMTDIVVIDILPFVGDVGVLDPQDRLTEWRPNLAGPVTPPVGVTVYYSTESNPCRTELGYTSVGCVAANWSTAPPSDITQVQSLKFDFGSIVLAPADSLYLTWPMRAPVNAPSNGEIAWNSFGYIGTRTDNNNPLLPSEPIKVGIKLDPVEPAVYGDFVWLDTNQDGLQDAGENGVSGVTVEIYQDNGDGISNPATDLYIGFTVTDINGNYIFPNLPAGNYFAVIYPPAGYVISPSNQGINDTIDSDGVIMPVTDLVPNEWDLTWDLGIYPSATCDLNINNIVVSPCSWNGTASIATANVLVSWANAPAGEDIVVTLNGQTQTIPSGSTSPQMLVFNNLPANSQTYNVVAAFASTSTCSDTKPALMPVSCQPNVCAINVVSALPTACDIVTGTYNLNVTLGYSNSPSGDITLTVGGVNYTVTPTGNSPESFTLLGLTANAEIGVDITAAFAADAACTNTLLDAYDEPTCAATCSLTITSATPTACDPATNTYDLAVAVTYTNPPAGDMTINIGGTNYTVTPTGSGSDTFTINDLSANGTAGIDVSATFVGDAACTHTLVDAYNAPASCGSDFPDPYPCTSATLLVGDLFPSGSGQTVAFPFGTGAIEPPMCTTSLPFGGEGMQYCTTNNKVYISDADGSIVVWDVATNSQEATIPLGAGPFDAALSNDCSYLYVSMAAKVIAIDLSTNTVAYQRPIADFTGGTGQLWGVDVNPITGQVYVTRGFSTFSSGTIYSLNPDLQGTITTVVAEETGGFFMGMEFLPSGNFWVVWDADSGGGEEIRLYSSSGVLLDTIPMVIGGIAIDDTSPNDIAFGPDGNIYVSTYTTYCVIRYLPATDTWEVYLPLDPSGAQGKSLAFVCANMLCTTSCTLTASADGTNVLCNGGTDGTATATASGNTAAVTYLWSNGVTTATISNLAAGTYTVTISESASCTAIASYTVTEPLVMNITCDKTDVTTNGGSDGTATVSATGGISPYTYLWDSGETTATISSKTSGTYTVTVTDANGCTDVCNSTINEPGCNLSASADGTNVLCNGGSDGTATATASGNTAAVTYAWSNGGTTATISNLAAGTYSVTISESASCTAIASYTVTEPLVMDITCDKTDVTTNGGSDGTATVSATGGISPYTYLWNSGETTASISGKTSGTYTVTVTDANGCTDVCASSINEPGALCNLTGAGLAAVICNDSSTSADATDDYIGFTLNPTGTTLGSGYVVTVSSGSITPNTGTYGAASNFQLQNGSAGSGNTITVTITDNVDSNCKVQIDVADTGTCSTPVCPPVQCFPVSIIKSNP